MKIKTHQIIIAAICIVMAAAAFFADKLPFFKSTVEERTIVGEPGSWEYFLSLRPLLYIIAAAVLIIIAVIVIRNKKIDHAQGTYESCRARKAGRLNEAKHLTARGLNSSINRKTGDLNKAAAGKTGERNRTVLDKAANGKSPVRKAGAFSVIRWLIMIAAAVVLIFGGWIFGLKIASIDIPLLSCPWNTEQSIESSCYFLAHLTELFEMPVWSIITFFASSLFFIILLGRAICGFLCPMGLLQDIMDKIRQKRRIEGITMNDKRYRMLMPVKWTLLFLMIGLSFVGGSFCNFCPAIAVSPVLAGVGVSLYVSGFMMILVLVGSFFKRRVWCNVCPLGYIIGLFHRFSLFRIKKDCQACTECGACYEACPMGIKIIYTERDKADVTEANCIMCGECIKRCPEDNALSMTFAGLKLYKASRENVMKAYKPGPYRADHEK